MRNQHAFALVLSLCLLLAARALWKALRRRANKHSCSTRYPIVLLHGYGHGGSDKTDEKQRTEYFHGIKESLIAYGADVRVVQVAPYGTIEARAEELAEAIRQFDAPKVNLVAHSMGGLDARRAITLCGLASRVASLTTIGTPHRGTPLADLGWSMLRLPWMYASLCAAVGVKKGGLADLSVVSMRRFNEEVPDVSGVHYASIVCRASAINGTLHPLLRWSHQLLTMLVGENDGLVPLASQSWGKLLLEIDADHWAQVGWSDTFDAPGLYRQLASGLKKQGL